MATVRLGRYEVQQDELPPVCMRCGAPATVWKRKKFSWYPPWVNVLILVAVLVAVIVALCLTKRMTVRVPFCDEHKNHWRNRSLFNLLGLVAVLLLGIGATVAVSALDRNGERLFGLACAGSVVLGLIWLIAVAVLQTTAIHPTEITERSITLTRVSPEFIDAVEEERDQDRAEPDEEPARPKPRLKPRKTDQYYDPEPPKSRRSPPDAFQGEEP